MLTLMLRQGLLLALFASSSVTIFARSSVNVPRGKPALIDGRYSADEWRDATEVSASRTNPFLADEAKEFQISRQRFTGSQWQMMFDIGSPPDAIVFPNNADKLKSAKWITLKL